MAIVDIPITRRDQATAEPLMVMLHRWYLENRSALQDLLVLLTFSIITFVLMITYEFTELFFEFTREYEEFELDEIIFTFIFVQALYLPVFALRRWFEGVRFQRQSNTDSLTKLANRRRGWQVLEAEIARATRYTSPLAITLFDIDRFKAVNDEYGHLRGDRLLEDLAENLLPAIRANDTLVRWGGEEFLVISSDTDHRGAIQMAERLRARIETNCRYGPICVTASFGVAQWQASDTIETVIQRADEKLYQAKANGRNRVE